MISFSIFSILYFFYIYVVYSVSPFEFISEYERTKHNLKIYKKKYLKLLRKNWENLDLKEFIKILDETLQIRQLPIKRIVPIKKINEEFLKNYIEKTIPEEEKDLSFIEKVLKIMGLIPKNYKLKKELINLYLSQTAGFYDYHSQNFYMLDYFSLREDDISKIIVSHEITHFLQDINFNIKKLLSWADGNTDKKMVVSYILEGDATYTMLEWYYEFGSNKLIPYTLKNYLFINEQSKELSKVPIIIKNQLIFPYLKGQLFFQYLKLHLKNKDWQNLPYKKIPLSTEMLLHPQKYIEYKDFPQKITLPQQYSKGKIIYTNIMGEANLYSIISQFNKNCNLYSKDIAAGWGGDRYFLFSDNHLIWIIAFDTKKDTKEFSIFMGKNIKNWNKETRKNGYKLSYTFENNHFILNFQPIQK